VFRKRGRQLLPSGKRALVWIVGGTISLSCIFYGGDLICNWKRIVCEELQLLVVLVCVLLGDIWHLLAMWPKNSWRVVEWELNKNANMGDIDDVQLFDWWLAGGYHFQRHECDWRNLAQLGLHLASNICPNPWICHWQPTLQSFKKRPINHFVWDHLRLKPLNLADLKFQWADFAWSWLSYANCEQRHLQHCRHLLRWKLGRNLCDPKWARG